MVYFFLSSSVYGQTNKLAERHSCVGVWKNNVTWAIRKSKVNNQLKLNDKADKTLYVLLTTSSKSTSTGSGRRQVIIIRIIARKKAIQNKITKTI